MKTTCLLKHSCSILLLLIACTASAATVSWTGASGDNLWNTPGNWTGGNVPGPGDDVIINVAGSPVVVLDTVGATVRSIQCAESFQLDNNTLSLTGGNSSFTGPVNIVGSWLYLEGVDTVVNASGPTTWVSGTCQASGGAQVWLTNVTSMVMTNASMAWNSIGADTAIYLSNLTNILNESGYSLTIAAADGGWVDLRRLSNLQGYFAVYSTSPGSVVDLSSLGTLGSTIGSFSLNADGGEILIPKVTAMTYGTVSVNADGQINLPLLKSIEGSSFTASGSAKLWLTNLTTLVATNSSVAFSAQGVGSEIHAFNVTNLIGDETFGNYPLTINADQGGLVDLRRLNGLGGAISANSYSPTSIVNLSGLSGTLTGPERGTHSFTAQSGGTILMPQVTGFIRAWVTVHGDGQVGFGPLTTLESSTIYAYEGAQLWLTNLTTLVVGNSSLAISASGAGSVIDLSKVTNVVNEMGYSLAISAYNGGLVDLHQLRKPTGSLTVNSQMAGSVVDLSGFNGVLGDLPGQYINLSAAYGGIISMPQVTALYNTGVYVNGDGEVDFGPLTDVQGCTFSAAEGAKLWLTNLTALTLTNTTMSFHAQGPDSAIYLSNVTNIFSGPFNTLTVQATAGGFIDLQRLRNPDGALSAIVQSEGSVVDLSSITGTFTGPSNNWHSISVQGGTLLMPGVNALERVYVYLYAGGNLVTEQLRSIVHSTISIDAATNNFSTLTNIVDSSLNASTGAKLWFTNATTLYITNGSISLNSSGLDTAIYLPNVTNVVYHENGYTLSVTASGGGAIDLQRLPNPHGRLSVSSVSAGSVVNLSAFTGTFAGTSLWQQYLSVSDGGTVLMPGVTALDYVDLSITGEAGLPLAQWGTITSSRVSLYSATNDFGGLTNLAGTSFHTYSAAKLWLTNFTTLYITNGSVSLQAWYADSAIYLPNVTNVVIDPSSSFYIHAWQGGFIDLHAVGDISGGVFSVSSRYTDSVIDLSGLNALTPRLSGSSLYADQGGVILLNDNAVLIYNVGLNFESSPNGLIPAFANPGNEMTLYARQWNAYLIEARDTRVPNGPWNLYLRVPMTNAIQVVAAFPPPDLAFRVTPLLADPPALRIDRLAPQQTEVTLFGLPGQSYRIESKSALGTAETWQNGPTVTLTNAFRIFPEAASADPSRYYRARKL